MYQYKAKVLRVVDADTIDFLVDLGFRIHHKIRARVLDWDAPEIRTRDLEEKKLGIALTERACQYLPLDQEVIIETIEMDSFGRWLSKITLLDGRDYVTIMKEEMNKLSET